MASELIPEAFSQGAKQTVSGTYTALIYVGIIIAVAALVWFVWWWFSHNRFVIVNYVTKGGVKLLYTDWAKKKHYKGAEYWKLRRLNKMWLAPPAGAIRITKKGRFSAECTYHEQDDHPIWVELLDRDVVDRDGLAVNKNQTYFAPEDRALLVEQLEEAENRKKKILDMLLQLAAPMMMLMFFVLVLVFWANIWEPMKESQAQMAVISTQQAKISEQNTRLFLVLAGKLEKNEISVKQVVPTDVQLFGVNQTLG